MNGSLGRYRLIAELGRGGMGTVYLAVVRGPARFSKLVVVKQLRPDFVGDANFTAMFLEEARLAARLHHPNIVQTNEVVCDPNDGHFMVMEYLEGASLKRVIRRLRARSDQSARRLYLRAILDVLTALHYAHSLKDFDGTSLHLVHRDVNPDNVFILHTGEVKLLDFGIAKAADSTQETRVGMLKGKLHYMSPEQMAGDEIDCRGDVFAVGTMLWDALTGQRLWDGMKGLDIMSALAQGFIGAPRSVNPDVPEHLDHICAKALALRPEDRYSDAAAFRVELERSLAAGEVMSNSELATAMSGEFLEEQERMRALIAEQLQTIDDVPLTSLPNASLHLPSVQPNTGVSIRPSQTRDALALQADASSADVQPQHRQVSWLAGATMMIAVLGIGVGAWALRSHVLVVDTAPGASSLHVPPAPSAAADPVPAAPDTASRGAAPPAPAVSADLPEPRVVGRVRRAARREAAATFAAGPHPSAPADRSGPAPAGIDGAAAPSPASSPAVVAAAAAPVATDVSPPAPAGVAHAQALAPQATPGSIPAELSNAVVRSHSAEIMRCFDRAQMDQLYLKCRVEMSATVAPDGRVAGVTTSASRDGTSRLQACIRETVQGWVFPAPAGGVPGNVKKTFVFD